MNEMTLFAKSLKDFFTRPILKIALYPFFITLILMYVFFFTAADFGLDSMQNHVLQVQQQHTAIENGEVVTTTTNETYFGKGVVDYLLQFSITSWLVGFLVYTLGTIFVMLFSLFIALIVVGFLTPSILKVLQQRHYKELEFKGYGNLFNTTYVFFKSFFVMILLFILLAPLYFIPVLNIVAINLPFYYFFYKLLNFDVTSTVMNKSEEAFIKTKEGSRFHLRTVLLYLISMIPFIALFSTVFYIVYLGHAYLQNLESIRKQGIPLDN